MGGSDDQNSFENTSTEDFENVFRKRNKIPKDILEMRERKYKQIKDDSEKKRLARVRAKARIEKVEEKAEKQVKRRAEKVHFI